MEEEARTINAVEDVVALLELDGTFLEYAGLPGT